MVARDGIEPPPAFVAGPKASELNGLESANNRKWGDLLLLYIEGPISRSARTSIYRAGANGTGILPRLSTVTCPEIAEHASGRRQKCLPSCPRCRQQVRSTSPRVSALK